MIPLLAAPFGDLEQYMVFAGGVLYVLYMLAGIFKKKRDEAKTIDTTPAERPASRPGTVGRPKPTPPRPPRVAPPPTPPRPAAPPLEQRPQPVRARPPTHRPQPTAAQPVERIRRPKKERRVDAQHEDHHTERQGLKRLKATIEPGGEACAVDAGEDRKDARKAHGRRSRTPRAQLDRVLARRAGLQAAVMLSEILAPPVTLRDDHLER